MNRRELLPHLLAIAGIGTAVGMAKRNEPVVQKPEETGDWPMTADGRAIVSIASPVSQSDPFFAGCVWVMPDEFRAIVLARGLRLGKHEK